MGEDETVEKFDSYVSALDAFNETDKECALWQRPHGVVAELIHAKTRIDRKVP